MTDERDADIYLEDIVEASRKAMAFVEGLSYEEFKDDDRTCFAVIRALEIIGEAAKQVPEHLRDQAREVPWQDMAGMRDKLIHGYHGVDLRVLWRTIEEDLPQVIVHVQRLLEPRADFEKTEEET